MTKRLSLYSKYKLKYTNRSAYNYYKYLLQLERVVQPQLSVSPKELYSFKHSGNCGDIIYAIPTMLGLATTSLCNLYLDVNQLTHVSSRYERPLGNVMLNTPMVEKLKALLCHQSYINECMTYNDQPIDYDLAKFREYPLKLDRGNIARWNMLVYPVTYDLNEAWLTAPKETGLENAILIARSLRYNAPAISYNFLNKYPNLYFIGLQEEYIAMHKQIKNLKYLPVKDFLQLAGYIAGAKLFIGNQSFPFAIAEAMKVNRILEVYFLSPNVNVYGTNGFDFCFQPQFEHLVKMRYENL